MKILFIDAAFRNGSRTKTLAVKFLQKYDKALITTVELGKDNPAPLDEELLRIYNNSVATKCFDNKIFSQAKEFAEADEIIIAAPFWNFTLPAVLHSYLELVCSQGVTFDMDDKGNYFSKCKAKKLTFITTAGGFIPEHDHAFSYIKDLCEVFWNINDIKYIKAEGLDIYGTDIETKLNAALEE